MSSQSNSNQFFGVKVSQVGVPVNQAADTQLVYKSNFSTNLFNGPGGTWKVMEGTRVPTIGNGLTVPQQGFWIAEDGVDVQQATDAQMVFNSNATTHSAYPVGSIYISTMDTDPALLFGFGTWVAFAQGQVLVGKAASGTFGTAGATGGTETVTLTSAQSGVPAHTHAESVGNGAPGGTALVAQANYTGGNFATANTTSANTAANAASAHNNLQPYIVVYMWNRTA